MEMFEYFSEKLKQIVNNSFEEARKMKHHYVGTEHLVLSLFKMKSELIFKVKMDYGISYRELRDEIVRMVGYGKDLVIVEGFTPRAKECLDMSHTESVRLGSRLVEPEHLFLSIFEDYDSIAVKAIENIGFSVFELKSDLIKELDKRDKAKKTDSNGKKKTAIEKYGVNLSELAAKDVLDPLIGREMQIERTIQVLCRRSKNNPCLIGKPGVGKTAIVEGLAQKIASGNVPPKLMNKTIVSLSLGTILAGTKYRGEFEERLNQIIKNVMNSDTVLFIDEIHTLVGAGGAEGAVDAANILKPLLTKGEFQVIGATTTDEYRKYIEKDAALERRFQSIMVDEPSIEETIEILKGLKKSYEQHHGIIITDKAIEKAVVLSERYIRDRQLPDKAIDIVDEAGAKMHINQSEKSNVLTEDLITEVISVLCGVPISKLNENEKERLKNLKSEIGKRIIGQEDAVELITKAIKRGRVGLSHPGQPVGSFLFLGSTGVGKTEMAKVIGEVLFSGRENFVKLDMSEYMEKHAISKLIGAPPGYLGHDEGGMLTERIRNNPYSVVLFDEIEKAHEDILNVLLQILGDGKLTDSKGREVDFSNCIVVLTSNIGKEEASGSVVGFTQNSTKEKDAFKVSVLKTLKAMVKPEILNRLDEVIVFNQLTKADLQGILENYVEDFKERLKRIDIELEILESVKNEVVEVGFSEEYGARELKRIFIDQVEDFITEEIIDDAIGEGDSVVIDIKEDELIIKRIKD